MIAHIFNGYDTGNVLVNMKKVRHSVDNIQAGQIRVAAE